jgi:hypothetical protein
VARELAMGGAARAAVRAGRQLHLRALEGDWSAEHEIDPRSSTRRCGWATCTGRHHYLGLLAEKRLYQGDFAGAERASAQIDAIWQDYQYDLAKTNHYWLRTLAALDRSASRTRAAAIEYYEENPEDLLHLLALGCRAKSEVLLGDLDAAERSLAEDGRDRRPREARAAYHAIASRRRACCST